MPHTGVFIMRPFFLVLVLALVIVSCATPGRPVATPAAVAMIWSIPQPKPALSSGQAVAEGGAALDIRIKWPAKRVQLLPGSVSRVDLTVKSGSAILAGPRSILRVPASAQATGSFEHLPVGVVTLWASARDASEVEIASGSTLVTLVPNRRVAATLELTPTNGPVISDFSPKAAGPGTWVTVAGNNFSSAMQMSVLVGGVPAGNTDPRGKTELVFQVPAGATTSAISVVVDGIAAISAAEFTTLGSISLSPTVAQVVATGSNIPLTVTAFDTSNPPVVVLGATVNWYLSDLTGVNPVLLPTPAPTPTPSPTPLPTPTPTPTATPSYAPVTTPTLSPTPAVEYSQAPPPSAPGTLGTFSRTDGITGAAGTASTVFTAVSTGSGLINVSCGDLRATVSVKVQ